MNKIKLYRRKTYKSFIEKTLSKKIKTFIFQKVNCRNYKNILAALQKHVVNSQIYLNDKMTLKGDSQTIPIKGNYFKNVLSYLKNYDPLNSIRKF